ncbi:unnamed protein product [Phytomonas sp. EM1]|nr:unnamed protein product [Phytomonas sp. EM1]|eukprot:CCW60378.1 unnamed protein product [Phytomonas sp. isolate EM1]
MPGSIVPACGIAPEKLLAKQQYKVDNISQNMFSVATQKDKKLIVPSTLLQGVTIEKLWENIFEGSEFLQNYHDRRKATDIVISPWEYTSDYSSGYRFLTLMMIMDVPKANTAAQLNEVHRFAYTSAPDNKLLLVYQISSQIPSIPAGTSFRTESLLEIAADSPTADCCVTIWGCCKKMSLAFSAIQYVVLPRALKEMTSGYKLMVSMIAERLCKDKAVTIPQLQNGDSGEGNETLAKSDFDNGGGSSSDANPSTFLHGTLLLLALMVSLILLWSMSSIRGAAQEVARVSHLMQMRDEGVGWTGCSQGIKANNVFSKREGGTPSGVLTEEDVLLSAAREAHVRMLRAHLLEQRGIISQMQRSMLWMRIMLYIQWILFVVVAVKKYFFGG